MISDKLGRARHGPTRHTPDVYVESGEDMSVLIGSFRFVASLVHDVTDQVCSHRVRRGKLLNRSQFNQLQSSSTGLEHREPTAATAPRSDDRRIPLQRADRLPLSTGPPSHTTTNGLPGSVEHLHHRGGHETSY